MQPSRQPPQQSVQRGVVAVIRRGSRWLVIRRSEHVTAPGAFCFPGGGIEGGETEEQALRREILEELGCEIQTPQRLWHSVTAWQIELSWWRAELTLQAVLQPDPREVQSLHWLTPPEIRQLPGLLSSNHRFLDAWEAGHFTF